MYPLTKFIQQYVPSAKLVEEIGQDIIFVLPGTGFSKIIAFSSLNSEKNIIFFLLRGIIAKLNMFDKQNDKNG